MDKKRGLLPILAALIGITTLALLHRRRRVGEPRANPVPSQAFYQNFAPLYDFLFSAPYARSRKRAVQLLQLQPGDRLLIPGVGTGLDLPLIAAGVQVMGADISIEMLQLAAQKHSPAAVELTQMDAQRLELPAESFDAVLLNLIVSVAPDGSAVFQAAWQALKPGGRLVLLDKFLPEGEPVGLLRRVLGGVFHFIGTDINRSLRSVMGEVKDAVIELNEPCLFFGQYRILKIIKRA